MTTPDITKLIVRTALREPAGIRPALSPDQWENFCGVLPSCLEQSGRCRGSAARGIRQDLDQSPTRFADIGIEPDLLAGRIARNHCIDRIRARRMVSVDIDCRLRHCRSDAGPGTQADASECADACGLPGRARTRARGCCPGRLSRWRSYASLAERYGVPLNTMENLAARSLLNTERMPRTMTPEDDQDLERHDDDTIAPSMC